MGSDGKGAGYPIILSFPRKRESRSRTDWIPDQVRNDGKKEWIPGQARNDDKDAEIDALQARNAELEERLTKLEQLL